MKIDGVIQRDTDMNKEEKEVVHFRWDRASKEYWQGIADGQGLTLSDIIRLVLRDRTPPDVLAKTKNEETNKEE